MKNGSIMFAGLGPLTLLLRALLVAGLVAAGPMSMPVDVLAAGASGNTTAEQFICNDWDDQKQVVGAFQAVVLDADADRTDDRSFFRLASTSASASKPLTVRREVPPLRGRPSHPSRAHLPTGPPSHS
jgi:hypothetical protein